MRRCLQLLLAVRRQQGAPFLITFTGLTNGEARPGDHASIGYTIDPDNGTETVKWSYSSDKGAAGIGTGANPPDYTDGDEGSLWLHVTDGGETVSRSAPIRYAAPVLATPAEASGQPISGESLTGVAATYTGGGLGSVTSEWQSSTDNVNWTDTGDTDLTSPALALGGFLRFVSSVTNSGGTVTSISDSIGPGVARPTFSITSFGPQASEAADVPLVLTDLSEGNLDVYGILTTAAQTTLTPEQVIAGDDENDAAAADTFSTTLVGFSGSIDLALLDSLDDDYYANIVVVGSVSGIASLPEEAGPTAIDNVVAAGYATATDLFETGSISTTEVTDAMAIGTADADREVLFLIGMQGANALPGTYDFTVNTTSYEGGANELETLWNAGCSVAAYNVPVATGATATMGLTFGTGGDISLANTVIAIPHTGSVSDSLSVREGAGGALTGSITTAAAGTLHILIYGTGANFDGTTLTITSPSGAVLQSTILTTDDIAQDLHPNRANDGRAYIKLENTSSGSTSINITTDAGSPGEWSMVAVALDS